MNVVAVHSSANVGRSVVAPVADWLDARWPLIFAPVLAAFRVVVAAIGAARLPNE